MQRRASRRHGHRHTRSAVRQGWTAPGLHVAASQRRRTGGTAPARQAAPQPPSSTDDGGADDDHSAIGTAPALRYGGWCPRCGREHGIQADARALSEAQALRHQLDLHKRFDFEVPAERAERCFSTDYVWTLGPGRMLGVMVCRRRRRRTARALVTTATAPTPADARGDGGAGQGERQRVGEQEEDQQDVVVLKAFSGQMTERWDCPGWAGPVAGVTSQSDPYRQARAEIERLTAELQELEASQRQPLASPDNESPGGGLAAPGEAGAAAAAAAAHGGGWAASKRRRHAPRAEAAQRDWPEWARGQHALLVRRRKELSHALLAQVQDSYVTQDLRGRPVALAEAYAQSQQPPGASSAPAVTPAPAPAPASPPLPPDAAPLDAGGASASGAEAGVAPRQRELAPPLPLPASSASGSGAGGASGQRQQQQAAAPPGRPGAARFPAGTGDCCAPKLLHAASRLGLEPLSMVEFWYGCAPSSNTPQGRAAGRRRLRDGSGSGGEGAAPPPPPSRVHGHAYGPCDKCRAILGALLCAAP